MISFQKTNFDFFLSYIFKFGIFRVTSTSKAFAVSIRVCSNTIFWRRVKNLNPSYAEEKQVKPFLYWVDGVEWNSAYTKYSICGVVLYS